MGEYFETSHSQDFGLKHLSHHLDISRISISESEPTFVRLLRWKAAIAFKQLGFSFFDSLRLITSNSAKMLGLYDSGLGQISVGTPANFVAFENDVFSYRSKVLAVFVGESILCRPQIDF